jgi:hypothetical protein
VDGRGLKWAELSHDGRGVVGGERYISGGVRVGVGRDKG